MMPIVPKALPAEMAVTFDNVFTQDEIGVLETLAAKAAEQGGTGGGHSDDGIRKSKVTWIGFEGGNIAIYQRLAELVSEANAKFFRFDLTGLAEEVQLARYEAEDQGEYKWHQDFGNTSMVSRKLSLCMQLTDPAKYEGGELIIACGSQNKKAPRNRGSISVFPAYQLHCVTPVTSGVRHSLTAWVSGPAFR